MVQAFIFERYFLATRYFLLYILILLFHYTVKHFSTKKKVEVDFIPNNNNTMNTLHTPTPTTKWRKFFLKLWGFFSEFRTYRVRFAIKSTLMAEAISSLAFIPATRPYFTEFKMEWTLITVCSHLVS